MVTPRFRALTWKLLRDLWHLRGQMLSILLVVATGVMTVLTMRGGYESLLRSQATYYAQTRFPDLWSSLERAPRAVEGELGRIPGVSAVASRVTFMARLDLPGLDVPGMGLFVSIPDEGAGELGGVVLQGGRLPGPAAADEVVISRTFAEARGLLPGDTVRAIVNGRARDLQVVGSAVSPEHSYSVPPGALYPDDERYGVFWMRRGVLGPLYDMEGAFNEVVLDLAPGADADAVMARVDAVLDPYGGRGAYPRADQFSHLVLQGELDQNRVMGTVIPGVFLAVAAFLLHIVLNRLISTQRTQIGVLKAFGYTDREVGLHYVAMAGVAAGAGTLVGAVAGVWLGGAYVRLYGTYFNFPDLSYGFSVPLLATASLVTLGAAGLGALQGARSAAGLPPAEAMRPEPPPSFEPGLFERAGLGRVLPAAGRMILRSLERRPLRALFSSLGVAFSVAILVMGMFMFDGVTFMMDLQFRLAQREDLQVAFRQPLDVVVRHELARLDGVTAVELYRNEPARLKAGHREREVGLQGLSLDSRLRQVVVDEDDVRPLPAEGLVLSEILAERLRVQVGDTLEVELLEGRRSEGTLAVAAVVQDFIGVSATLNRDVLDALAGGGRTASGALLSVDAEARDRLLDRIEEAPAVASVQSPAMTLETFRAQLADSLFIAVGFLLGFAGLIAVAVIYNGARVSLSERGRELASLRVLGFRRREVAVLLLGEQAVVTVLAIPVGWLLGYLFSLSVVDSVRTETYRIALVISPRTYLISAAVTLLAAAASGWIVRRRIDHMDLIAVLKTRE
ncbi:MAG: FtsX-like permease family protein [Longimicrobiales bacterium]